MKLKKFNEINVIPFIDILLVLLAIVLTTAVFTQQSKIKVDLPVSESKEQHSSTHLDSKIISIDKENKIFLNEDLIAIEQLDREISNWDKQIDINLRVDKISHFQYFVDVISIIKKYSLTNVSIISTNQE